MNPIETDHDNDNAQEPKFCIYCRRPSDDAVGREHVIPEALGNPTWVLPRGAVCDRCNSFFGSKIDSPFVSAGIGAIRHLLAVRAKPGSTTWEGLPKGTKVSFDIPGLELPDGFRVKSVTASNPRWMNIDDLGPPTAQFNMEGIPTVSDRVTSKFMSRLLLATLAAYLGPDLALDEAFDPHRENMAKANDEDNLAFAARHVQGETAASPSCVMVLYPDRLLMDLWGFSQVVMRHDGLDVTSGGNSTIRLDLPRGPRIWFGLGEWTEERVQARIRSLHGPVKLPGIEPE